MTFVQGLLGRERKRFGLQRVIQRINLSAAPEQKGVSVLDGDHAAMRMKNTNLQLIADAYG
jgi:hypothetical protein